MILEIYLNKKITNIIKETKATSRAFSEVAKISCQRNIKLKTIFGRQEQ